MLTQKELTESLKVLIDEAGSQTLLAEKIGMTQSQISDYLRGRFQVENITLGILYRMFPKTTIHLFGDSPDSNQEPVAKSLEEQMNAFFKKLSPAEQVRCFSVMIALFPEKVEVNI